MKIFLDIKKYRKIIAWYSVVVIGLNLFLSLIPSFFSSNVNVAGNTTITLAVVFWSGLFAPFFEETFMRGILQRTLEVKTKLDIKIIYVIVALIFSFLHFNLYFIPYFLTSILLSHAYKKTNHTLIIPIVIHSIYNLFVLLIEMIMIN